MPPIDFGTIAFVIAGVLLAVTFGQVWAWASRVHAPTAFYVVLSLAYGIWVAVAAAVVAGWIPRELVLVPSVICLALPVAGRRLIALMGGTVGVADLLREWSAIAADVRRSDTLTEPEMAALRKKVLRLGRYRSPLTATFIDAAQEMLLDWADGRPVTPELHEERRQHVLALGDEIFVAENA